jgi:hypothetical protein
MTPVQQAKKARDAHWDSCRECVPPLLRCDEGRALHAALAAEVDEANTILLPAGPR